MIFRQSWKAKRVGEDKFFDASVPGNVQYDYASANGWGDINYNDNYKRYAGLEDDRWIYRTEFSISPAENERVFFVSGGIDYIFDIVLNGECLLHHEGMFTKIDLDITDKLVGENTLEIVIYPHPKRTGGFVNDRFEASASCKPPVSYGWDWHPRVIPSGIWNDAYIETRKADFINDFELMYELYDTLSTARIKVNCDCTVMPEWELYDGEECVYKGKDKDITLSGVKLWWCNGQGEPKLYTWRARTESDEKSGTIGFRQVELVMNDGAWDEPAIFPKSRSNPPATIKLNGREIFAKGSNWVNPEIFSGNITEDTYRPLVELARAANMNIFRVWGGGIINKKAFYDLCDENGIMVWQEFPLACNNYDDEDYLKILEQEAEAIVKNLRRHACHVLWCGGNELFNSWSKMTDQSYALRLLNAVCYRHDMKKPFIMTSPLMGMAHGGYTFWDDDLQIDVFELMQRSRNTAYTEFGVPGVSSLDHLRTFIPQEDLFPPRLGTAWEGHHALNSFGETRWLCLDIIEKYFGHIDNIEDMIYYSSWLQCEGYKAIFEEARRQRPYCSMAINWCYSEPWKTAANNSIVNYPAVPKKAYYAVRDALRPVLASARVGKFNYTEGEVFSAELWLLNDSPDDAEDVISVYIEHDGEEEFLLEWKTGVVAANTNKMGHKVQYIIPAVRDEKLILKLKSQNGYDSEYSFVVTGLKDKEETRQMNV